MTAAALRTSGAFQSDDGSLLMDGTVEHLGWYAIQVASKKEKFVASVLTEKGYECFLPLYPKRNIWSDRIKVMSVPLFVGYVFSRFDVRHRLPILVTPNVHAVVGHGKVPAAIPERDIDAIRIALQNGLPVEPHDCLQTGDIVRVIKGPLTGVEGSFIQYRGSCRLILSVPLIQRSVAVEIDRLCVEPLGRRTIPNHSHR
jgi:transcription antitermination factor NusG